MGAAALAADIGGVCVPLAVGSAVGSACTATHERCGQRICVVEGVPGAVALCAEVATCSPHRTFTVAGVAHSVSVANGIVGTFTGNEPVLGVRARTLPFVQALGKPADRRPTRRGAAGLLAAVGLLSSPQANESAAGAGSDAEMVEPLRKYTFSDLRFALPDLCMDDVVVIAFGTRTVVALPFFANAPLDFDILGTTEVPLRELLQSPRQPVEVTVPLAGVGAVDAVGVAKGNCARISLSFHVFGPDMQGAGDLKISSGPALPGGRFAAHSGGGGEAAVAFRCDSDDLEREIEALERQLRLLKEVPRQRGDEFPS
mmetsp:Transcript_56270/g.163124  ORF Transcript_56270/g.163124 Transcript_56270/m.163124 type:complete len:315 (-) Transcript_56270:152-1096(-)|eukprot:CAMPEP_0170259542 /NCGR_PEP_ID=MMETSP0116_2-20130129/29643_1 /TAXON_ID=400756 /ORGANISM="Durinskia baltica, Strain CSIRO CS-38" /LENGTH=314 /DNA_ID=CAMNT_0010510589 /DNA_START=101 /DNA_END=1045 /DNA_ORIENTATION=-